jgi:hypothetical protein
MNRPICAYSYGANEHVSRHSLLQDNLAEDLPHIVAAAQ